jgi:hypothetical protein
MCRQALTADTSALGGVVVLGEEAHIVSARPDGPRFRPLSAAEVDAYPNRILLCPTDHSLVDKDVESHTEARLLQIKRSHEAEVGQSADRAATRRVDATNPLHVVSQSGQGNVQNVAGRDLYVGIAQLTTPERARVRINAMDNGASEHGLRWFHLRAFTLSDVLAKQARVRVSVSGGRSERWLWAGRHEHLTLGQEGHEIPIVAGTFPKSVVAMKVGWRLEPRIWYRTPNADAVEGSRIAPFGTGTIFELEAIVSWPDGDREGWSRATFELRQTETENDAWLVKTAESDSFGIAREREARLVADARSRPMDSAERPVPAGLTRFKGRVTDTFGAPLAGVVVRPNGGSETLDVSDGGGRWDIDLPSGRTWPFSFERDAYERTDRTGTDANTLIDVVLKAGR